MLRDALALTVTTAIRRLIDSGELPAALGDLPVEIIDTKQPEHGDYACNFALAASKAAGMNPRQLAEKLSSAIFDADQRGVEFGGADARKMISEGSPARRPCPLPLIHRIDIAGPGFLNFRLIPTSVAWHLKPILEAGDDLPKQDPAERPLKINVEFVSVNPNGPITVGSGRGAAFGDTLSRVLEAAGHQVHREYYINDGVNSEQMRLFAESVRHYYLSALGEASDFPEKGYKGEYVQDVATEIAARFGNGHAAEPTSWFQSRSQELMIERQRTDLHTFGVDFDTWFSEQSLHESGEVASCIEQLVAKGAADEEPYRTTLKMGKGGVIEEVLREDQAAVADEDDAEAGAASAADGRTLWLRSTKFGDDMDRVLRRRDGRLTYITSDVAYHKEKLTDASGIRGMGPADKLITILGPDHHGYISRLQAVLAALLETLGVGDRAPAEALDETESRIYRSPEERDLCRSALEEARRRLEVVIFQIVRFVKEGKPAPMRKRDGNIYELRDLVTELGQAVAASATKEEQQRVGADVARFFYLMRSHETHMDFDIDLATKQSDENPVFYVQYAHARICSVIAKAETSLPSDALTAEPNVALLTHPRELSLIKKILDLPSEVKRSAEDYGVHRLAGYAVELARTYHHFYDQCRVVQPDEPALSVARLALCRGVASALKSTLALLGISAPERMEREAASA